MHLNIDTGIQIGENASKVLRGSSIKTIWKPGLLHAKHRGEQIMHRAIRSSLVLLLDNKLPKSIIHAHFYIKIIPVIKQAEWALPCHKLRERFSRNEFQIKMQCLKIPFRTSSGRAIVLVLGVTEVCIGQNRMMLQSYNTHCKTPKEVTGDG